MRYLGGIWFVAMFVAASIGGVSAADTASKSVDISKKPPYWRDARLEKAVEWPAALRDQTAYGKPRTMMRAEWREEGLTRRFAVRPLHAQLISGDELMTRIKKQTGVEVLLVGPWQQEAFVMPQGVPVRELMDDLAASFDGHWFLQGASWILARSQEEARLAGLSEEQRGEQSWTALRNLTAAIEPGQWAQLAQTGRLELGQLNTAARGAVKRYLLLVYYDPHADPGGGPSSEALETGQGVALRLLQSGKDCALYFEGTGRSSGGIPFVDAQTGKLNLGVPPPR